jgi:hypothetical protein
MQHKKLQGDIESKKIGINQKGAGRGETKTRDKRTGMSILVLFEENANI